MKYIIKLILISSSIWAACPDGYYEDDCGTCWAPYCYDYITHQVQYDLEENECSNNTQVWVIPGSEGDPYFNSYCDGYCPDNYSPDDCGHCWQSFCYSFFQEGLDGDPAHSVYYDLTIEECESYGYSYYSPDHPSNPYWNSNCSYDCAGVPNGDAVEDCSGLCDGDALVDDCGDCQQSYCYDYVTHQVNFDFPCDGATEMLVAPDDPSNPYWNSSCAEDCSGSWGGDALVDDCGDCQQSYCYDYVTHQVNFDFPCDGATEMLVAPDDPSNPYWNSTQDECGICNGPGYYFDGNSNEDCVLDILDVVALVQIIVNGLDYEYNPDINSDGIINILDVVALVGIVVNSGRTADANTAMINTSDNSVSITADGYIGGVQMTLSHDNGFEINLTDNALVAEYKTSGTSTILVVVAPEGDVLFTTNKSFEIVDMIVANSTDEIEVNTITDFGLSAAYPNPFNPSTTVSLTVPSADYVSVKVYNLMGQVVGVLADGMMEANVYSFTWDASNMSSGVYLVKAESSSSVDIQKVMLIK